MKVLEVARRAANLGGVRIEVDTIPKHEPRAL